MVYTPEHDEIVERLYWLEKGLYDRQRFDTIFQLKDQDLSLLNPHERNRFANNIANIAMELMTLAELIDEEEAKNYK